MENLIEQAQLNYREYFLCNTVEHCADCPSKIEDKRPWKYYSDLLGHPVSCASAQRLQLIEKASRV